MLSFHKKYAKDIYSQNGEDGVIEELIKRLGIRQGVVVEFGAHDGTFCSNSRHLIERGWRAFLLEADHDLFQKCVKLHINNDKVCTSHFFVSADNVNNLLPNVCNVLSIDVDGIDYRIWDAYRGNPDIVIIEINSSLPPESELRGDPQRGSSFRSMVMLGQRKGYFPICHCGNIIFVLEEFRYLFPEFDILVRSEEYFNTSWL